MLRLAVLGRPHITIDDGVVDGLMSHTKAVVLLVYLAMRGEVETRERMATLLWPTMTSERARANLRMAIYTIRQHLPDYIDASRTKVAFNTERAHWIDAEVLTAAAAGDGRSADQVTAAVELYRGDFLAGLHLDDSPAMEQWLLTQRERLRLHYIEALTWLIDYYSEENAPADAIDVAQQLLNVDPAREKVHRRLMRLLAGSGRYSEALRQYERCQQVLADELDVQPMPKTRALYDRIKAERASEEEIARPEGDAPTTSSAEMPAFLREPAPAAAEQSPFVAREAPLARLHHTLEETRTGSGQVVVVAGEAGAGKTTLMQEFVRRAESRADRLLAGIGRCTSYAGKGDPYHPFREVLAQLCGDVEAHVADGTLPREAARRLWEHRAAGIDALVTEGPDLVGNFVTEAAFRRTHGDDMPAQVRTLLDRAQESPPAQDRLYAQYTSVLTTLAEHHPLLLILDDLHWADASSIDLLFHLGRRIDGSRLLIAGTYRPERIAIGQDDTTHPLAAVLSEFKRHHGDIVIDLDRAVRGEGRHFVDAFLDSQPNHLDETFRAALYEHTQGHPLFVIEVLRHMQEQGVLVQDEAGRWCVRGEVAWDMLPARIEGVIEKRVGRLDAELRRVLDVASVEGETFTAEVVAGVLDLDRWALLHRLSGDASQQHRLVTEQGYRDVAGSRLSRYRFRHNLVQTYLYDELGEMERTALHEQVGRAMEQCYGDAGGDVAVQLAHHFEAAGRPHQAARYLLHAGTHARQLGGSREAITYLSEGVALLEHLPETQERMELELALQIPLGNAQMAARGYSAPEVEQALRRAQALCRRLDNPERLFPVMYGLWAFYAIGGDCVRALEYSRQFVQQAEAHDHPAQIVAHRTLLVTLLFMGRITDAQEQLEYVLANLDADQHHALRPHYSLDPAIATYMVGTWVAWAAGNDEQSIRLKQRGFELLESYPHPHSRTHALAFSAVLHQMKHEPELAREHAAGAIDVAEDKGFFAWLWMARAVLGWSQVVQETDVEGGVQHITRSIEAMETIDGGMLRIYALVVLVDAYSRLEGYAEPLAETFEAARTAMEQSALRLWEADLYRLWGEARCRQGDVEAGIDWLERARRRAAEQGAHALEARAAASLCQERQNET